MKRFICIIVVLLFSNINGQSTFEYAQKFTISEGLAHNGVTSMLEDKRGFLWFGTFEGLNKYDGYKFITYKNTIDKTILTSNRVRAISEHPNGNLWIGTDKGITVYDYTLESFKNLDENLIVLNEAIIRQIIFDTSSNVTLIVTEGSGVFLFDDQQEFLGQFFPDIDTPKSELVFFNAIPVDDQNYILSSSNGLYLFNLENYKFSQVLSNSIDYSEYIIRVDNHHFIAAHADGASILEFKKENETYSFYEKRKILNNYSIKSLLIDDIGNLWVGITRKGIVKIENFNITDSESDYIISKFNDDLRLLRSSALMQTSKNSCWLSTFNEGIYQFNTIESPFKSYNVKMDYPYGLKTNNVRHVTSIDNERSYLTSRDGSLVVFNTKAQKFEPISSQLLKPLASQIGAIFIDSKENIWFRIDGEAVLKRIKKGSTRIEIVKLEEDEVYPTIGIAPRSFSEDKYGNIWIGSNRGVYKVNVDPSNNINSLEHLNSNSYFAKQKLTVARFVYADPLHDFVWIGADSEGLFRVKTKDNAPIESFDVKQYKRNKNDKYSISSNFVSSVIRLPNEELWVGTEGGGICKVVDSETTPKFIAYTEKNGLSNNAVKSILYDEEYNLWITTNIGLNKLDTKDFSIRKFKKSDGLPFEDFFYAAKKLPNGVLFFSGLDGFCYFNPSAINQEEALPEIQFENFKIRNEVISPRDTIAGRVLLDKSLNEIDELILKHDENIFSLDLISLHFLNPQNHSIKYRLLPVSEEWIEVPSSQNTIQYNGLQHGEYTLNVMASNASNQWTVPKTLKITIKPSLWNTNFAYVMYAVLAFFLIFLVTQVILKIQALSHEVEIEQLTINNVKEINEEKLRFFSNISHEIKTPLTLISSPLETLLQSFKNNGAANSRLNLMKRQIRKIEQLIDQVHDFRRADANLLKMDYSRFWFNDFINELVEDFKFLARKDQKTLELAGEASKIIVSADRDKLEKIFNNLLNNAFKYTAANDSIIVGYTVEDKDLIITIEDTGKGIDEVDLPHVFERFYQSHNKQNVHISGSGIGLAFSKRLIEMHYGFISVTSEIGKGTKFTFSLPIVKAHSDKEDIVQAVRLPEEKEVTVDADLMQNQLQKKIDISGDFSDSLIFYVEDNSEMRNYVSEVLSEYFKVQTFSNGKECLDAMEDLWPDIVISDVQMPILNGLDLCIRIKSDLKTSHIPVILLTALTNIQDQVRGIRDGADAYIKKPFSAQHLITRTEALLINRKKLSERYQVGIPLTRDNNINDRNDNAFLDKLYSIIEENLGNQNFNLNDLAKQMYLNRTHFFQKVKALTNQTPFELLKMYRLKRASDFLLQKNMSVKEVSIESGFKSRTHFAKIFKERYNIPPGAYAEEMAKQQQDNNTKD